MTFEEYYNLWSNIQDAIVSLELVIKYKKVEGPLAEEYQIVIDSLKRQKTLLEEKMFHTA